jgi:hypothetical protein
MTASHHFRRLTWIAVLVVAGALAFGLTLHVNALKSEVRRAEMKLASLKREKLYLEVEFETRSNQQQLESWNDVEFGYVAPGPGQYFGDTRQLASLGRQAVPQLPDDAAGASEVRLAVATTDATATKPLPAIRAPAVRAQPVIPAERSRAASLAGSKVAVASSDRPARIERLALVAAVVEPLPDAEGLP